MNRTAILVAVFGFCFAGAGAAEACTFDAAKNRPTVRKDGQAYAGARAKPWYAQARPITLEGVSFKREGSPRLFGDYDFNYLERAGEFDGIMVFRDTEEDGVLFVPVDAKECTFHRYVKAG